jgi:hypothetical protein
VDGDECVQIVSPGGDVRELLRRSRGGIRGEQIGVVGDPVM